MGSATLNTSRIPPEILDQLSDSTRRCIKRLLEYTPERPDLSVSLISSGYKTSSSSNQPQSKLAAVLVLLYEQAGELRVLLTTRSKSLRTHAGQTALPGGKFEESDRSLVETAHREASEEVGLLLNSPDIHTITVLEPFVSLHKLIVTPVVAFLTRPAIINDLKAETTEVACIFNHSLRAILDPSLARSEPLVMRGNENWPYDTEYHNTSDLSVDIHRNTEYRMHRFRTSASPIKGLTADILIKAAEIAFGQRTMYERYAPNQVHGFAAIN